MRQRSIYLTIPPKRGIVLFKELIMAGWQKCWDDVVKKSGVSLDEQRARYEECFRPWPAPATTKKEPEVVGENPEYFVRNLKAGAKSIQKVKNLLALQSVIVIRNANEFLLRDDPTEDEFEALLNDFQRWELQTEACLVGGEVARQQVREELAVTVQVARNKFKELKHLKI